MLHEEKKVAKIVEELTMFFFTMGADEISSAISKREGTVAITVEANYQPKNESKILGMERYLNGQKNDGVEDIYWELAGSGDPGETSQLLLVGMMIDEAKLEIQNNTAKLTMFRKLSE